MKKFIFFIGFLFGTIHLMSQSYIGKSLGQIVVNSSYSFSNDSTEMWRKEEVSINIRNSNHQMVIHDVQNFKVTICNFNDSMDTCNSFMIVYYNLPKSFIYSLLNKKYKYNYNNEWVVNIDGINHAFCLREEDGGIIIIEVCEYISQNLN